MCEALLIVLRETKMNKMIYFIRWSQCKEDTRHIKGHGNEKEEIIQKGDLGGEKGIPGLR